jgi:hypothetical protein
LWEQQHAHNKFICHRNTKKTSMRGVNAILHSVPILTSK